MVRSVRLLLVPLLLLLQNYFVHFSPIPYLKRLYYYKAAARTHWRFGYPLFYLAREFGLRGGIKFRGPRSSSWFLMNQTLRGRKFSKFEQALVYRAAFLHKLLLINNQWAIQWHRHHLRKALRHIQKRHIGRFFVRWYGNTFPQRRNELQVWVNKVLHTFLRYYSREVAVLRVRGQYLADLWDIIYRLPDCSKWLWRVYGKYRRHKTWIARKAFTVEQQYKYYRRRKFLSRAADVKHDLGDITSRWVLRKLAVATNYRRIVWHLSLMYPSLDVSAPLHHFLAVLKKKALATTLFGQKIDYRRNYVCLFLRKKQNNYYLTATNGLGEQKISLSCGAYLLTVGENKRNKKLRRSFKYFEEFLKTFVDTLRQHRIIQIKYFFRPLGLRRKFVLMILNTLAERRITVEKILKGKVLRHRLKKRTKKIRRL